MTTVDLTLKKRQPVVFVPYERFAASGASQPISGFAGADTVTFQVSAQSTNAIAAGTVTVTVEDSGDGGSTWATVHAFGPFQPGSHDEEFTATGVSDTVRATWAITGTAAWRLAVTAVANAVFMSGAGGGGGPPTGVAGGDLSGNYPNPAIANLAVTDAKVATANKDGSAATPSMRTLGTGSLQAVAGNDARLSNSRAPTGNATGVLSGTYPNPGFAVDMATQAELNAAVATTTWPSTALNVFVDYANGSDSNTGLSPSLAFKTIQAAYNNLKSVANATYTPFTNGMAVGTITLLPGDHNVGPGVVIDRTRPVEITGFLGGAGVFQTTTNSTSRILTSSATATEMILTGILTDVSYGNRFTDLVFVVQPANTALTACVRARNNDYLEMERCQAFTSDSAQRDVPLLEQQSGAPGISDNAWLRFINNKGHRVPLYHATPGNSFNRSVLAFNNTDYNGTLPLIWLETQFLDSMVIGNNLEDGGSAAIKVGADGYPCRHVTFMNNGGESINSTYPFYDVVAAGHCQFIGGDTSARDNGVGTWIQFGPGTGTYPNEVRKSDLSYAGQAGWKRKIVDNSDFPTENVFYNRNGRILHQKTGSVQTFSATDFENTPTDGSMVGVTHDNVDGTRKLWMFVDGAYVSTTVAPYVFSFPTSSVLDTFTRADGALTSPWAAGTDPIAHVISNTCGSTSGAQSGYYTGLGMTANQEVFTTITTLPTAALSLLCRIDHTVGSGYLVRFVPPDAVTIRRYTAFGSTILTDFVQTVSAGDSLGLAAVGTTLVACYKPGAGSWTMLGMISDGTYATGPDIGFEINDTTCRIDSFGGGTRT